MSRDPKKDPRFGDVFTYPSASPVHVMFVCRSAGRGWSEGTDEGWTGIDLEQEGITDGYSPLRHWTFVTSLAPESLTGSALGDSWITKEMLREAMRDRPIKIVTTLS